MTYFAEDMETKKIFVSGCFDMLHSGHVAFLNEASSYGDLYVCIGSDKTVFELKGRYPVITEEERRYMIQALKCVHECRVNSGSGIIDFRKELDDIRPDIFVVNEDGNTPAKKHLCEELGIEYVVSRRIPYLHLPARSTTSLRTSCIIPFRIDIAGGWLDQPFVSKYHPGAVLTISIEPTVEFNNRSGMSSSTRNKAIELWKIAIPNGDPEQLAKVLFSYENPPGTKEVSGSQDALGIVMPGLNRLYYTGNFWPEEIHSVYEEDILQWLESSLYLIPLDPRQGDYKVLNNTQIDAEGAGLLAKAADDCWEAILKKDIETFGAAFYQSLQAQLKMFPNMVDDSILEIMKEYRSKCKGFKLSGAGGGGYLILVNDRPVENAIQVKIRRRDTL
jgi:cytidyltransferase-like protein